ncbi:MurR/RpiR family transcriptional regulator [Paracoccus onubensis]|uniref:MurR/RpiR family transcriptional regulator n=1 Tax=Paracoccus onubensis TaxID=1675788 RepID=UPI00272FEFA3|nr:MurR/RpiR family transcriptional regulator [Paracoccus onubensis]MDP0927051.1 MurR/RpiR family transcriptional regulator [Paracoccus onubensis]
MSQNLVHLIRNSASSGGERKVAAALLDGYPFHALSTVEALAKRADVSNPTVLRFLTKIGFPRFADFQAAVVVEVQKQAGSPLQQIDASQSETPEGANLYQTSLRRQAEALRLTAEAVVPAEVDAFVALLANPRHRIQCLGGRYSQNLSRRFSRQLAQLRADVLQIEPQPGFHHEPLLDMGPRDVLVMFDYRRYQPDLFAFARLARETGTRICLFTDDDRSPVAGIAHAVMSAKEGLISPFGSRIVATAQIETIIAAVVEADRLAARQRLERIEELRIRLAELTRLAENRTGMDE